MSKYRIVREYRSIPDRVMHGVERKGWFFWWWVSFKRTKEEAESLIETLKEIDND